MHEQLIKELMTLTSTDKVMANRAMNYGITAGGVYVPLQLDAAGATVISGSVTANNNIVDKQSPNLMIGIDDTILAAATATSALLQIQDRFAIGLQIDLTFNGAATLGAELKMGQSSSAVIDVDTIPFIDEPLALPAGGGQIIQSFLIYTSLEYIRVQIVNLDPAQSITLANANVIQI